ncbi:DEKNAAC102167 [Brettanomyces naardenensis]|uniref:RNA polymerase II subunit B1 CTD phosphatase RPAP2 homolog n=1 Tax=Brettanomyces naardenensis TaxID=13370 RepID=A0A448YK24_BRENA|nr:DEKNAAC102167 [Brettanomyces naardenensis]
MVENCDRETLKILARYLSRQSFDDLVEERVTNHYCGYPLCKYSDPSQIKEMQMNKVVVKLRMPRYYNSKYCCKRHYQAAEFYKRQLSSEALFMRTNMDEPFFRSDTYENAIVLLEEYFEAKRGNNVNLNTPAMNELMVLMEKMQIEDDEVDGEVVEDNKLADITVVEKQGPQQSNSSYGEGGAGGGVGGGL